jgi:hypothetical protein
MSGPASCHRLVAQQLAPAACRPAAAQHPVTADSRLHPHIPCHTLRHPPLHHPPTHTHTGRSCPSWPSWTTPTSCAATEATCRAAPAPSSSQGCASAAWTGWVPYCDRGAVHVHVRGCLSPFQGVSDGSTRWQSLRVTRRVRDTCGVRQLRQPTQLSLEPTSWSLGRWGPAVAHMHAQEHACPAPNDSPPPLSPCCLLPPPADDPLLQEAAWHRPAAAPHTDCGAARGLSALAPAPQHRAQVSLEGCSWESEPAGKCLVSARVRQCCFRPAFQGMHTAASTVQPC